jgi:hypothetical protein
MRKRKWRERGRRKGKRGKEGRGTCGSWSLPNAHIKLLKMMMIMMTTTAVMVIMMEMVMVMVMVMMVVVMVVPLQPAPDAARICPSTVRQESPQPIAQSRGRRRGLPKLSQLAQRCCAIHHLCWPRAAYCACVC